MDIRNPIFSSTDTIDCEVKHPYYGWIPFTAKEDDVEEHGREIFFAIREVAKPYEPDMCMISNEVRLIRDNLLLELDAIVMNPLRWKFLSEETKRDIECYRQKLLDVPQQSTFPNTIDWPAKPDFQ